MFLRIQDLSRKKLIGKHLSMSLVNNSTHQLWSSFMPERKNVTNNIGTELYSMQVYPPVFDFKNFTPNTVFEKWAAIEVNSFEVIPQGMDAYLLESGLYAVFLHKGAASTGEQTFRYIFETWLPSSGYEIDNRPHFELLGNKYINNHPDSEEEIWIPIKAPLKTA